jgi:ABC-2 type transport system ATP-binding protein
MKQRLVVASALLRSLTDAGKTIFMSTHSLEVAEELCDRIGIILNGKLIAYGSLDELRQQAGQNEDRLEDIFLKLTAAPDMLNVIEALRV